MDKLPNIYRRVASAQVRASTFLFWASIALGILWRYEHALVLNRASQLRVSDMRGYMTWAENRCAGKPEDITSTIHAPGASILFSAIYCPRGSWSDVELALFGMSVLAVFLVWLLAHQLDLSAPAKNLSVIFASLYPPFVSFAGLFMAELPLLCVFLAAANCFLFAMRRGASTGADPIPEGPNVAAVLWAFCAGLLFGVATVIKTQALLVMLFYLVHRAVAGRRQLSLRLPLLAVLLGFSIPAGFSANRCTRLSEGRFCLVANDVAQNMLFAFVPDLRLLTFRGDNFFFEYGSPAAIEGGETVERTYDFVPWDRKRLNTILWATIREQPFAVLWRSVRHCYQVFGGSPLWPPLIWDRTIYRTNLPFVAIFLVPFATALWVTRGRLRALLPRDAWILVLPLLSIFCVSFICSGESRYRVPFDGFSVILGAHLWVELSRRFRSASSQSREVVES